MSWSTADRWRLHRVDPNDAPGLSEVTRSVLSGERQLRTAAPLLDSLDLPPRVGPAWSDPDLAAELRSRHEALGASDASRSNLADLVEGRAGCVITGQQPGLLAGSLMSVYKVAGAVALARAMTERGRPTVAVYWCGADDSDFQEVRQAWLWSSRADVFRAELPESLWTDGQRVGDLRGPELARVERDALHHAGPAFGADHVRGIQEGLPSDLDFGDRAQAWMLRLFGDDGLVVVDARSSRLRELGRDLFERYAVGHAASTQALLDRTAELTRDGSGTPLADGALRSGLFRVEGERRTKLGPQELSRPLGGVDLAPSVLLRPLWQDALLAPLAAVLGPAELSYHQQIAPLYEALDVVAAHPVPRPHLTLLPPGLEWPEGGELRRDLLRGGESAARVLTELALPAPWRDAANATRHAGEDALRELDRTLGSEGASRALQAWSQRQSGEWGRLIEMLESVALEQQASARPSWRWAPLWLAPQQKPQERILSAVTGWWLWGDGFPSILDQLGRGYVRAVVESQSTVFVAVEDRS